MKTTLLFFFILITSTFTYSQWTRTGGPEGISIGSLLNVGSTLYAGTLTDGVYASTNGGVNWFSRNSGIETLGILSLASGPGFLYAGTNGNGVYRSTNAGQTWLSPSNENDINVHSLAVKGQYVFAGALGLFRCSNNGETWTNINPSSNIFEAICVDGNKIFASKYGHTVVSTDDGSSWSNVDDLTGSAGWSLYCSGNLIIAGSVNAIFRSTDQGNSFVQITINFNNSFVNIYALTAIGSTLFFATSYDGVYKSTDNGSTWTSSNTGMGPKDVRALIVTGSSSLMAGAYYAGVIRSTNTGASWNRSVSGFPSGSSVTGLYSSGSTVLAGTHDGVFRSLNNGLTWNKLTGTNDTVNYSLVRGICLKGDTIFIGTIYQLQATVYRSTDNGATWEMRGNGFPANLSDINSLTVSGNNILAASSGGIYYSSNYGDNWIHANSPSKEVTNIAKGGVYEYAPYSDLESIYRSADDGVNWSVISQAVADVYTSISARDNFACVGSIFQSIHVSTNNGANWVSVSGIPLSTTVYSVYYVPNSSMVLAAVDLGPDYIFISTDNGISFSSYSDGLGVNASAKWFTATDSFLIAGTDYNGVWRRIRPELVGVASQQNEVPREYQLEQNYPNPFNPTTKINYSIPRTGFISLKIYDMLGREVAVLVNEFKQPGKYSLTWDAGGTASGIYFYKITSEQFTSIKKMVLMK
jgi:photosystem II stability/assembly factor-like uncharacterized protein